MLPNPEEVPEFYRPYIRTLPDEDLSTLLTITEERLLSAVRHISQEQSIMTYAEGKWNVLEVIQHILDAERVFCYRALTFSRNDGTGLPGFEQDEWMQTCEATNRILKDQIEELRTLRKSTSNLFLSFSGKQLSYKGMASGHQFSTNAICHITLGHMMHHANVLHERYLPVVHG